MPYIDTGSDTEIQLDKNRLWFYIKENLNLIVIYSGVNIQS